jgi:hypothetical protein
LRIIILRGVVGRLLGEGHILGAASLLDAALRRQIYANDTPVGLGYFRGMTFSLNANILGGRVKMDEVVSGQFHSLL